MQRRPGGELATRPLHFFWVCDSSGSMSFDNKIQTLNAAIRDSLPAMRKVADDNPNAEVLMRALRFSVGASWHVPQAMPLRDFVWNDIPADATIMAGDVHADVIFMMDTSGSMRDAIDSLKESCVTFADRLIQEGASVRMGLIGFDIGGHQRKTAWSYTVHNLSRYTIGVWPLTSPEEFKRNIQSLAPDLFGGNGCYLADEDSVEIFPHVVRAFESNLFSRLVSAIRPFNERRFHKRILVILSDEMGSGTGVQPIVEQLKSASIVTYVMGVGTPDGAHEQLAHMTGGSCWDITMTRSVDTFNTLFKTVAHTIAREAIQKLPTGGMSAGTDMGAALKLLSEQLRTPPMPPRALPPVLALVSDGQPTDDFDDGLQMLMEQPWGKKSVRVAIAIGRDADEDTLARFIGNSNIPVLHADNPEELAMHIRWISTTVLEAASSPSTQVDATLGLPIPDVPKASRKRSKSARVDVW